MEIDVFVDIHSYELYKIYCGFLSSNIVEKYKYLVGTKIDKLTVIGLPFTVGKVYNHKNRKNPDQTRKVHVVVECECGNILCRSIQVLLYQKKHRKIKSIGCDRCNRKNLIKHGKSDSKIYKAWFAMKRRCSDNNYPQDALYRRNGIKVCEEWKNSFESFYNWSIKNGYFDQPKGLKRGEVLSIDRIDAMGDYCPANCRWITMRQNRINVTKERDETIKRLKNRCILLEKLLEENGIEIPE